MLGLERESQSRTATRSLQGRDPVGVSVHLQAMPRNPSRHGPILLGA